VPFGGVRIIDFTLKLRQLRHPAHGICTQYPGRKASSARAARLELSRRALRQFVELLPAQQRPGAQDWYRGTADAVYQNLDMLRRHAPDYVLILAGDHVYKMDYGKMLAEHVWRRARMSVACIEVPLTDARSLGVMQVDGRWRITGFQEKSQNPSPIPGKPDRALASMGSSTCSTRRFYTMSSTATRKRREPATISATTSFPGWLSGATRSTPTASPPAA
jgi:glucose-1-phosphate adenylyltransferase